MFQAVAKQDLVRRIPLDWVVAASTLGAFAWMLVQGRIHPVMVAVVELYLAF